MTTAVIERVGGSGWAAVDRAIRMASTILSILSAVCVMSMMVLITADVMNRVLVGGSIPGVYELVETLVVLVAFLGLAIAERTNQNVRIELLTNRLPDRAARFLRVVGNVVGLVIVVLFAVATWETGVHALLANDTRQGLVNFPLWPARFVVAIGFTFLALELVCTIVRKAAGIRQDINPEVSI